MINNLKKKNFENGFTLIEMLVVITILGILMGIAVLGFSGANRASIIKSCKVDYLSVQSALNSLKNDYPDGVTIGPIPPLLNPNLYSKDPGTLANLGYMSLLGNKDKYLITIKEGRMESNTDITSLIEIEDVPGTPAVKIDCLKPL
jgi:prepilin-type N-terminal cleavage/methylation domain-containing protein